MGFKINPQGFIWAEEEFWSEHSLFHFPLRLTADKEFLEKASDKEAYTFMNVLS